MLLGMFLFLLGFYFMYFAYVLLGIPDVDWGYHKLRIQSDDFNSLSETKLLLANSWN